MRPPDDIDGTAKTFGLWHPEDLLAKLSWEYDLASSLRLSNPEHFLFALMNAFASAWHMAEWVWEAMRPETRQKLSVMKLTDYQKDVIERCPELILCQQIGNAGKHRRLTRNNQPAVRTDILYMLRFQASAHSKVDIVGFDPPQHRVLSGQEVYDALAVAAAARDFWQAELATLVRTHEI